MKHILLTNDDGFDANGLVCLANALSKIALVTIVAPKNEKSACGHSITITKPLKIKKIKNNYYKVDDGTPSDCIFLALNTVLKDKRPDLVISGINHGSNMGEDITYSGTAGGAMEGVLQGIPSISISQVYNLSNKDSINFDLACDTITKIVTNVFNNKFPLPNRKFLNINIPHINSEKLNGYKITKCGSRVYCSGVESNKDPRGEIYYWLGTHPLSWDKENDDISTDFDAIHNNYISITPITLNMTSISDIDIMNEWISKIQ
jgi:5'-nucleotidase